MCLSCADSYFSPWMVPLFYILTYVYNTVSQCWNQRGSRITATAVGTLLQEISMVTWYEHINFYLIRVYREDNKMVDVVYRITYLSDCKFLYHFQATLSKRNSWFLLPLMYKFRQHLTPMLYNKNSTNVSLL